MTDHTIREALEPCPFCGEDGNDQGLVLDDHEIPALAHRQHFVFCAGCGARGPLAARKTEAVQRWNKRTLTRLEFTPSTDEPNVLVEFFRGDGYTAYGHRGDYEGWTPEQTAVHFLSEHLKAKTEWPIRTPSTDEGTVEREIIARALFAKRYPGSRISADALVKRPEPEEAVPAWDHMCGADADVVIHALQSRATIATLSPQTTGDVEAEAREWTLGNQVEAMGEALFALSDSIRGLGCLEDERFHQRYEVAVKRWGELTRALQSRSPAPVEDERGREG
jgi:Lar family restriction alleviation protein